MDLQEKRAYLGQAKPEACLRGNAGVKLHAYVLVLQALEQMILATTAVIYKIMLYGRLGAASHFADIWHSVNAFMIIDCQHGTATPDRRCASLGPTQQCGCLAQTAWYSTSVHHIDCHIPR